MSNTSLLWFTALLLGIVVALYDPNQAHAHGSFCAEVSECVPEKPEHRCLDYHILYFPCAGKENRHVVEGDRSKRVKLCRYDYDTEAVTRVGPRYRSVVDAKVDAFGRNELLCHRINLPPFRHVPWYQE